MIKAKRDRHVRRGWLFQDMDGNRWKATELQEDMFKVLEQVQEETVHISAEVDVRSEYGVYRSLRRGSTTHAVNMGVKEPDIERNNRWRKVEAAGGKQPGLSMMDHYTEIKQALTTLLRYSSAL